MLLSSLLTLPTQATAATTPLAIQTALVMEDAFWVNASARLAGRRLIAPSRFCLVPTAALALEFAKQMVLASAHTDVPELIALRSLQL